MTTLEKIQKCCQLANRFIDLNFRAEITEAEITEREAIKIEIEELKKEIREEATK